MIIAKNLYLTYDNHKYIIKKGEFTIKEGEFIFIGGNSGSGKSTLLKSFYGELGIRHGDLNIASQSVVGIRGNRLRTLRKDIGIIFQDYKLINEFTIEENIMVPLRINNYIEETSKKQADDLLKHVKLYHKKGSYPNQLSGGEQQRIAVARALAHNPKLIIADEPTGNLDDTSADVVWNLLKSANERLGITIVVVTHRVPRHLGIKFRQLSIVDGAICELS